MAKLYKLENEVKHYAWGSANMLPELMGKSNTSGEPWAELWMGVHPGAPSKTTASGKTIPLSEVTALPFLFKFLAAGSPLSIQAHPDLAQAKAGYERENKAGIPLSAPNRNYRDPNHKPEIICALSSFTAMAGFREPAETKELLTAVDGTDDLRAALKEGYRAFLAALFGLSETEKKTLNDSVLKALGREKSAGGGFRFPTASLAENTVEKDASPLQLCGELAHFYPRDPGIIAPLYLNTIKLKPYEALFLPAGVLHAYIHGLAMECMANSDNVLRGGLTTKHIDLNELFSILDFKPFKPELLKPLQGTSPGCYSYKMPCKEFALYLIQYPVLSPDPVLPGGTALDLPNMGIFAVYDGCAELSMRQSDGKISEKIVLNKGESAFISQREKGEVILLSGDFTLFAALARE